MEDAAAAAAAAAAASAGGQLLEDLVGITTPPLDDDFHACIEGGIFSEQISNEHDSAIAAAAAAAAYNVDMVPPFFAPASAVDSGFYRHPLERSLSIGHLPISSFPPPFASMEHQQQQHQLQQHFELEQDQFSFIPSSLMRRYSTGDLQPSIASFNSSMSNAPAPAAAPSSTSPAFDETTKVGRYTPEERKVRIDRYRQKRTERNFIKKIKYACRKTLADSRPRIRGRFAKNQDSGIPIKRKFEDDDDEDCLEEDEDYFVVDKDTCSNKLVKELGSEDSDFFRIAFDNV